MMQAEIDVCVELLHDMRTKWYATHPKECPLRKDRLPWHFALSWLLELELYLRWYRRGEGENILNQFYAWTVSWQKEHELHGCGHERDWESLFLSKVDMITACAQEAIDRERSASGSTEAH